MRPSIGDEILFVSRHKCFSFGMLPLAQYRWSLRFGFQRSPKALDEFHGLIEAFADEVGVENVISITGDGTLHTMITVWYREEVRDKPKPARVGVDDGYFAPAGG